MKKTTEPIPYTGESEEFLVKITDEELAGVMDDNGNIQFSKVVNFCVLHFDHGVLDNVAFGPKRPYLNLWEWQVAHMGNYMLYLINHHGFKPKYYCPCDPENPICILLHYVC